MDSVSGVDISNWQGPVQTETARCLAEQVKIVVVRLSLESPYHVAVANQQIRTCQAAGLQVHGYLWMYPTWEPGKTVKDAMREYGIYNLPWVWIDAEEDKEIANPQVNGAWLRAALADLKAWGVRAGIYTGAWWWNDPRFMAGSTEFKEVPLWYAEYDGNPDLFRWTPFGGWLNPGGKQYDTTHGMCGIDPIDRNTFAAWVYQPTPDPEPKPEPEPEPTMDQVKLGLIDKVLREDWAALKRDATKLAG